MMFENYFYVTCLQPEISEKSYVCGLLSGRDFVRSLLLYEFPWLIAQEQQISSQVQLSATQTLQKQSNAVVTTIIVLWADYIMFSLQPATDSSSS